jgi:hypothetical protein
MVAFSAGWAVWGTPWRHALAAAVAGLAVMLLSGMAQRRDLPAKRPGETPVALVQPGPADPGNLHISGR